MIRLGSEVILRVVGRHAEIACEGFVPPTLPPVVRCAPLLAILGRLARFESRLGRRDLREALLASLQLGGQLIASDVRAVRGILRGVDRRRLRR
jgi:hypothetical protein